MRSQVSPEMNSSVSITQIQPHCDRHQGVTTGRGWRARCRAIAVAAVVVPVEARDGGVGSWDDANGLLEAEDVRGCSLNTSVSKVYSGFIGRYFLKNSTTSTIGSIKIKVATNRIKKSVTDEGL